MESRMREVREKKDGILAIPFSNKLVICLYSQKVLVSYEMMGVKARLQWIKGSIDNEVEIGYNCTFKAKRNKKQ